MLSVTVIIIIITCLVSYAAFKNMKLAEDMLFWPAEIQSGNQYYRFFSYGLIHADFMHLIFNMLSLYSLGEVLEKRSFVMVFGGQARLFYLLLYVSAIVISTIPDYLRNKNNPAYRALGASGAVSAVIFACIILEPSLRLSLFLLPIPIPGYIFAILFVAVSAYLAKKGGDNIGHGAHLTGAFYGLLFTIIFTRIFAGYDSIGIFLRSIINR